MESNRAYVDENGEARVVCSNCGKAIKIKVKGSKYQGQILKITCPCKSILSFILERRSHYRKSVGLLGLYFPERPNEQGKEMKVENISTIGVGFRTIGPNSLKEGDVVGILFHLDDYAGSIIDRRAIVRNVQERYIGAEFCDRKRDKALGFYLKT